MSCTRRVSFQEEQDLIPSSSPLDQLDCTEWSTTAWYSPADMETFRAEARAAIRQIRSAHHTNARRISMAWDPQTRGLERMTCKERQRRRAMGVQCILQAHAVTDCPEQLAVYANKCSQWVADLAAKEGVRDFLRAYAGNYRSSSRSTPVVKRAAATAEVATRRVRRRTMMEPQFTLVQA